VPSNGSTCLSALGTIVCTLAADHCLRDASKAVLHHPEESALLVNRYIHLNPVRIQRLGGHEGRAGADERLGSPDQHASDELLRARVQMLNTYRWSSYPAYVGRVKKPKWLSTESIQSLFGYSSVQSFRLAYRLQVEEMAGLGKCHHSWQDSIKASVLYGSEEFVVKMLAELQGDRREQRGMREKERLGLGWPRIVEAIAKVWQAPWEVVCRQRGNGAIGLAYYLGQRCAGMTLRQLGRQMGNVEYPAVSVTIARFERRLKSDRSLQKKRKQVAKLLHVEI
jgi:hypothetical protein